MKTTNSCGFWAMLAGASTLPALLADRAWAQPATDPASPAASAWGNGATVAVGAAIAVAVLAIVVALVKMLDLRRKREMEAVQLQAQVADALLREQGLFSMAVTPTAHVPFWGGGPAVLELAGQVPSEQERRAVIRVAEQEAHRVRPDVRIESRIGVAPALERQAA